MPPRRTPAASQPVSTAALREQILAALPQVYGHQTSSYTLERFCIALTKQPGYWAATAIAELALPASLSGDDHPTDIGLKDEFIEAYGEDKTHALEQLWDAVQLRLEDAKKRDNWKVGDGTGLGPGGLRW